MVVFGWLVPIILAITMTVGHPLPPPHQDQDVHLHWISTPITP